MINKGNLRLLASAQATRLDDIYYIIRIKIPMSSCLNTFLLVEQGRDEPVVTHYTNNFTNNRANRLKPRHCCVSALSIIRDCGHEKYDLLYF